MYEKYWQLTQRPFENFGTQSAYYPSEVHQTAMLKLRYALESRRSALAVCGDSGTGKSMLVDLLVSQIPDDLAPVVKIVFPQLSGDQLLGYLTDKLTGTIGDANEPPRLTLARLEAFLDRNVTNGKQAVVIVDEAHLLESNGQLETLRLLLNLSGKRAEAEAAITLVLVGHSILMNLIEQNRALDERVSEKCFLNRFTPVQSVGYLQHRVAAVGGDAMQIFAENAFECLHTRALGIPRRLNRLADLALMVGFAEEASQVTADHIEGVHKELAMSL